MKKGYVDAFFVILIWSGFVLISRMGGKSELLPGDVMALRFGTASVLLVPFWLWRNRVNIASPPILALGLTGGIGYAALAYFGFKNAPAAHASVLLPGLLPFEMTLLSWLLLHDRPTRRRMEGLAAIALGVACLGVEAFNTGFSTWKGDVALVGASLCWALYTVLVRRWKISAWDATIGSALVGAFLYLPVYCLLMPKHLHAAPWGMIGMQAFYQGVMAIIVAMVLYIRAVNALGAAKTGICMALVPVISGIAAVPLLGEPLTPFIMAGLAFTSIGAWLGNRG